MIELADLMGYDIRVVIVIGIHRKFWGCHGDMMGRIIGEYIYSDNGRLYPPVSLNMASGEVSELQWRCVKRCSWDLPASHVSLPESSFDKMQTSMGRTIWQCVKTLYPW